MKSFSYLLVVLFVMLTLAFVMPVADAAPPGTRMETIKTTVVSIRNYLDANDYRYCDIKVAKGYNGNVIRGAYGTECLLHGTSRITLNYSVHTVNGLVWSWKVRRMVQNTTNIYTLDSFYAGW